MSLSSESYQFCKSPRIVFSSDKYLLFNQRTKNSIIIGLKISGLLGLFISPEMDCFASCDYYFPLRASEGYKLMETVKPIILV